eukprot:365979-Chlamydomonas_euryale.AAC.5
MATEHKGPGCMLRHVAPEHGNRAKGPRVHAAPRSPRAWQQSTRAQGARCATQPQSMATEQKGPGCTLRHVAPEHGNTSQGHRVSVAWRGSQHRLAERGSLRWTGNVCQECTDTEVLWHRFVDLSCVSHTHMRAQQSPLLPRPSNTTATTPFLALSLHRRQRSQP